MVGHASVLVEHDGLTIWTDPWLRGTAFNDGWEVHPDPVIRDEQRRAVTHLWISHEHPDHLSIPTLKSIPPDERAGLTVLYQRHFSSEVVDWLRRQGFARVIELTHGRWYRLTPELRICSHQVGHEDSSMTFQGGGRTVLNLNDCKPPDVSLRRMLRQIGPVDLLLDQFSIAGWAGNPGDVTDHEQHAAEARDVFLHHLAVVAPDKVLPFASFMRFAHEENAYLNAAGVPLDEIAERVPADRLVVLAPGESWDLDTPSPHPGPALDHYRRARQQLDGLPLLRSDPVPFEEVVDAAERRMADLRASYQAFILRRVPPVTFAADDVGCALRVHPLDGVHEVPFEAASPAVRASSQALAHTFRFRFGLATLLISGRFRLDEGAGPAFDRFKQLGAAYGSGFTTRSLWRRLGDQRAREFASRRLVDLYPQFVRKAID